MVNKLAQSHPASELERKHHGPCSQVTYSLGTRHTMTIQSSKECWDGGRESDGIVALPGKRNNALGEEERLPYTRVKM